MRKVLVTLLAVLCFSSFAFASMPNVNATPDEDWAERTANKPTITHVAKAASATPYAAGDYYIPKGTNDLGFVSLEAAVDSINLHGAGGVVNLLLDADTLREASLTFDADLNADSNVVVKPAAGRDVVLIVEPGPSINNGPQMIGFNKGYVTFDGSNDGSGSRNLIITSEGNADVPVGLNTKDADNIIIKNLIIKNLDNGADDFKYGVISNDVGGNSFTVDNCQIGSPDHPAWRDGVAVWGDWTNLYTDAVVVNNDIHAGARGISTYIYGDCVFSNNTVNMYPSATTYAYNYGIYLSWGPSAEIHNNVINAAIEKTTGSVAKIGGIVSASNPAGGEYSVVNNMVNVGAADETVPTYGLLQMSSGDARNWNVYHNTFVVNDNASVDPCHGIGNSSTGPITLDLKNNIIINNHTGSTESSAISLVNTSSVLTSANNILVSDQNCVYFQDSAYVNLADWQGTGQDLKSDSLDVTFAAAGDFHLAAPSDTDVDLVYPKVPGVDTDIDGDARPNPSFAFAGADEGSETTAYPDYDIDEDFADDSDVVNWRSENEGWTSAAHADTVLRLTDSGWTFDARRTVKAMPNSFYKATARIKTGSFDTATSQFLYFGVDGLSAEPYQVSCISEDEFTTFTVVGYAENDEGSLYIFGQGASGADTVWVDEYTFENNFVPGANKISTVAEARQVPDGELVATQGIVTANTIGAPIFMQDENAGIALYDWDFIDDGVVEEGDEILVIGEADSYGGLKEISYTNEKYHVISKGNEVEPILITVPDLESRDYQGMLVMIEDIDTVAGEFAWPDAGSDATIPVMDADSNEFNLRIDKDGEMDGAAPPEKWPLILVGVVGEFFDGPQVLPRYMEDFITNYAPGPFTLLNPVHEDTITSLDDPAFADINIGTETIKTLFFNWTESIDPDEGDEVSYEVFINPEGPEEALTTSDTVFNLPIPEDRPWDMNGTYDIHVTATDLMDAVTSTDTISVTFDFKAPPELEFADVVLVDGVPKFYAEFTMPVVQELGDYKFVDYTDGEAVSDPTAIDSIAPNAIMLSGDLAEDHQVALRYSGVAAEGDDAEEPLTVDAESKTIDVLIPFSDAHPEDAEKVIEDFEDGTGTFWAPTGSGSTYGILTTSTFEATDSLAYEGTQSGMLTLLDDPAREGGWYVRLYHQLSHSVSGDSKIMLMVRGTNANVEMRLSVKDESGYEQGPWKSVSLDSTDWQVVSFDLLNDDAEGWITGDGEFTGDGLIEAIHMRCSEDTDVTMFVDGFTERMVLTPVNITLNVIMKQRVETGVFDKGADFVDVAGTFNDWSGTYMHDYDNDTTYSVTLPLIPYSHHEFKFRINGSWDDETAEFPSGGDNRVINVRDYDRSYTYWYNDDTLEVAIDGIPDEFALHQNYPNPFNPTTTINFDLPEASDVKLVIYDISGRKIRTLVDGNNIDAGYKRIVWNGRDDFGNGVATGMYIYRLQAGKFVDVKKMTFLK